MGERRTKGPAWHAPIEDLPDAEVTAVHASRRPSEAPGEDRYREIATLGVGGMGRVVLSRDVQMNRDVAVKVLHEDLGQDPAYRARFVREALIQGQLDHPCIVPVYDLPAEGAPRFSMRYVRGRLLSEVIGALRSGTGEGASRRRLLTVFSSVCGAVHFAHARGVLHRDLKPENVMLGEFGEVYVLDWGIARLLDEERAQVEAPLRREYKTESGHATGTPGFIAPEVWIGADVDARADVYALGMTLFEILTHEPYHEGADRLALRRSTFLGEPRVPSACRPDLAIPPELDRICARASSLARDNRYESAGALRDAVERFLDGDRDVALRHEAAASSAAEADALATEALSEGGSDAARTGAMRCVGRALALDPESGSAMNTLVRLLLAPPRSVPPEISEAIDAERAARVRTTARVGMWAHLAWLPVLPVLLALGVGGARLLAGVTAVRLGSAAVAHWQATRPRLTPLGSYMMLGATTLGIASLSVFTSSLLMVPTALLANTLIVLTNGHIAKRWVPVAACALGMFGPIALELAGALPRTFRFEGGDLVVLPALAGMRGSVTLALVVLYHAVVLVAAALAIVRARGTAAQHLERLNLLAWNLKQLAPSGARVAVERVAPRPATPRA